MHVCVDETEGSADACQRVHKLEPVFTYSMCACMFVSVCARLHCLF